MTSSNGIPNFHFLKQYSLQAGPCISRPRDPRGETPFLCQVGLFQDPKVRLLHRVHGDSNLSTGANVSVKSTPAICRKPLIHNRAQARRWEAVLLSNPFGPECLASLGQICQHPNIVFYQCLKFVIHCCLPLFSIWAALCFCKGFWFRDLVIFVVVLGRFSSG